MRKHLAALAAILLGASPALADAFSNEYTTMVTRLPTLTPPYQTGDRLSVVRNGIPYKVPLPAIPISPILNLYPANSYGSCTWDATHDVGACINLAVAAAAAAGGGTVVCPAGTFGLSTMVRVQTSNIGLYCEGTTLKWIGAAGGRMVSVDAPFGDLGKQRLVGNRIDIWVDGNGLAADGLYLASLYQYQVNFRASGVFNGGNVLSLDVVPAVPGSTFLGAIDIQAGNVRYLIDVTGTSKSLYLGNYVTDPAGSHGNASFNDFYESDISSNSATAIYCYGCDNNTWHKGRVFNGNISVDLTFAQTGAARFPANGNKFLNGFQYTGSFQARGTPTVAACVPVTINPIATACTYANWIERDQTNASPGPTIEAGADLKSGSNEGFLSGLSFYGDAGRPGIVATEAGSTIQACLANAFSFGNLGSSYLCNTNGGGINFFDNLAGSRFALKFNGVGAAADLQFLHPAGTGSYEFADSVKLTGGAKLGSKLLISPTAPTIASGGCTTGSAQSVSQSNGSAAFAITLGGATCGSTIVLTMPAANAGWVCDAHDITTPASNTVDQTAGGSATSVTLTNYARTTGLAANFTGADVLAVKCLPY